MIEETVSEATCHGQRVTKLLEMRVRRQRKCCRWQLQEFRQRQQPAARRSERNGTASLVVAAGIQLVSA